MIQRWFTASVVIGLLFLAGCIVVPARPGVVAPYGHPYRHHHYYER